MLQELWIFINGFFLGIAIAAPVGPIALLCIKRTLLHGRIIGISTGLGAAAADSLYGAIAVIGITMILDFIQGHHHEFRLFGGMLLVFLAFNTYNSDPRNINKSPDAKSWLSAFLTGFFLTLTNPLTLIAFITSFAAFGIGSGFTKLDKVTFIIGILAGASSWWLFLNWIVLMFRKKISATLVTKINKSAAVVLLLIALYAILTGTAHLLGLDFLAMV